MSTHIKHFYEEIPKSSYPSYLDRDPNEQTAEKIQVVSKIFEPVLYMTLNVEFAVTKQIYYGR